MLDGALTTHWLVCGPVCGVRRPSTWTCLPPKLRKQREPLPMIFWCFCITVLTVYWVEHGLAIRKNVKPPEGVAFSGGSLGREADCKNKANVTCDNIWYYSTSASTLFSSRLTRGVGGWRTRRSSCHKDHRHRSRSTLVVITHVCPVQQARPDVPLRRKGIRFTYTARPQLMVLSQSSRWTTSSLSVLTQGTLAKVEATRQSCGPVRPWVRETTHSGLTMTPNQGKAA